MHTMRKSDFTVEWVDAKKAHKYLESAKDQTGKSINVRHTNDSLVKSMGRDMANGKWCEPAGDPLKFTPDGKMLNGQHRCKAVIFADDIKPGIRVRFAIQKNVPIEVASFVDSGIPRSLSTRTGVARQHGEIFNSIANDIMSRARINPQDNIKLDEALGKTIDEFIKYLPKGRQPAVVGNANVKKAVVIRAQNGSKQYVYELYRDLVKYAQDYAEDNTTSIPSHLPPIAKSFIMDVFHGAYGAGKRAPSGRESKKELFAQSMYMFDLENRQKRSIDEATNDRYIYQLV